jgi:short subunit dehydrogenase-like uncharacterized protein
MELLDQAKKSRELRRLVGDPHALDPVRNASARDPFEADQRGVRYDEDLGRWTAPFIMSAVNTRVVRRSNALVKYGERFRYQESMSMPPGPKGMLAASAVTAALGGFVAAVMFSPTRSLISRALPKPGEGPSAEAREKGYFEAHVLAETTSGKRLRGRVASQGDPGYNATAKMLGESALALALDADRLPDRYGVLTPASAMSMRIIERLRDAGMTFDVSS